MCRPTYTDADTKLIKIMHAHCTSVIVHYDVVQMNNGVWRALGVFYSS